jgi:phosphonatase-like hydrolase
MAGTTVADRGDVPAAFTEALAEAGITTSAAQLSDVRGSSKRDAVRRLLGAAATDADVARVYDNFTKRLSARYANGGAAPIAGAAEQIARLRAHGVRVALNTGFDRAITSQLLDALGWRDMADAVICGDDVAAGRPAPDMIRAAMRRCGVTNAADVANVGDTTLDLEAAHAAGTGWNIGVWSGAHDRARLAGAPHSHLLPSVADVAALWGL